jgi:hypothetical protein
MLFGWTNDVPSRSRAPLFLTNLLRLSVCFPVDTAGCVMDAVLACELRFEEGMS